jgi:hypothetical protein
LFAQAGKMHIQYKHKQKQKQKQLFIFEDHGKKISGKYDLLLSLLG